jgi:hypothetical protein
VAVLKEQPMRKPIIHMAMATGLALTLTACSASVTDARPTPAPPQQPQVIVIQSAPPTVINNDDVMLLLLAGVTIALTHIRHWLSKSKLHTKPPSNILIGQPLGQCFWKGSGAAELGFAEGAESH